MKKLFALFAIFLVFGCIGGGAAPTVTPSPSPTIGANVTPSATPAGTKTLVEPVNEDELNGLVSDANSLTTMISDLNNSLNMTEDVYLG
jgi:hypothetical protein